MAIPIETFVPEYIDGLKVTFQPWIDRSMTPNEWFRRHCAKFVYPDAKEMIPAEAVEYDPETVPDMPGIYFLVYGDEVGYVGKASDIQRRLAEHRKKGMTFDKYWCFGGVPNMYLHDVESFYVELLKPELNMNAHYFASKCMRQFL